jgi:hypothetical protein
MTRLAGVVVVVLAGCATPASAQQILIDRGVRAGSLWCFPVLTEQKTYVYLPSDARLAQDDQGRPQFSFVRYATNDAASDGTGPIAASGGGGVLHFLVLMETPPRAVESAQQELRRVLNDDEVQLRGPVVFGSGRYALVSSVLNPSTATPERKLLATGRAPVLEGNRLAFSFDLEPAEATLLLRSFEMRTSDVSIVFEMAFSGLTDAYDADLTIDWSEVRKHKSFSAGGSVYYVGAAVEAAFSELRRDNAIKLRSSGTDASMEALLSTVYSKLLELMFRPVESESAPSGTRGSIVDALDALASGKGPFSSRKTVGFGLNVAYQLKDLRTSGTTTLNFNHRATVERHSFVTFNIGDLHRRHGKDPDYFRAVNLADPTFQQREIHIGIDGAVLPEFDKAINGVTLTLRKQHQNGQETVRELVLDRATIAKSSSGFRLVYGWNGDEDRTAWLEYDYRTRWSFKGGGSHETPWTRGTSPLIDLFAPYERRTIQVVGSRETLQKHHVRAVIVEVEYGFFGDRRRHQIVVRPDQQSAAEPLVEATLPLGEFQYDYVVTWQFEGNRRVSSRGRDTAGVVFVDELPEGGTQW